MTLARVELGHHEEEHVVRREAELRVHRRHRARIDPLRAPEAGIDADARHVLDAGSEAGGTGGLAVLAIDGDEGVAPGRGQALGIAEHGIGQGPAMAMKMKAVAV